MPTCPGWAAEAALELGLEVWLSPDLWDHDADDTLAHLVSAAAVAEEVRRADHLLLASD